jgi:hypothetical protein
MRWQRKQGRGVAVLAVLALLLSLLVPGLVSARDRLDGPGSMVCSAAGLMPAPMDPDSGSPAQDCKACLLHGQAWAPPGERLALGSSGDPCIPGQDEGRSAPRIGQWRRAQPHAP